MLQYNEEARTAKTENGGGVNPLKELFQGVTHVNKYLSDIDVDKRAVCAKLNQRHFIIERKISGAKKKKYVPSPTLRTSPPQPNNKLFRKVICTFVQTAKIDMKLSLKVAIRCERSPAGVVDFLASLLQVKEKHLKIIPKPV